MRQSKRPRRPLRNRRAATTLRVGAVAIVDHRILDVRGVRVMLDRDLAILYGVTTSALNQAVSRNLVRFPADFMFQLTEREVLGLTSQIVITKMGRGGTRTQPRAFTEQGVAMLSSVLRSRRAVLVNIAIMRAFARLRGTLAAHTDLVRRIDDLERRYDGNFRSIFEAIRELVEDAAPLEKRRRIGF
jgi:hypothetical protein